MSNRVSQFNLAIRGPLGDYSDVIASGSASQKILDASDFWSWIFIQNPSDQNESLFVNFGADASVTDHKSVELLPSESLWYKTPGYIPNQDVYATAATTNHPYVCKAY